MSIQNIIVAGKSGAGKQPRIDVLVQAYGLRQLSTGNIFREYLGAFKKVRGAAKTDGLWRGAGGRGEEKANGVFADDETIAAALAGPAAEAGVPVQSAVLGFKAAQYVDRGLFVPDDITNALLAAAFEAAGGTGLALDGYPRTVDQSRFLLDLVARAGSRIDFILVVDNEDEAIVARTVGRRICPNSACGKVFHLQFKPPAANGTCTACGTPVILRSDDTEEKIRTRLAEFQNKALPAVLHLKDAGIPMVSVAGNLPVFTDEAVKISVMDAIRGVVG